MIQNEYIFLFPELVLVSGGFTIDAIFDDALLNSDSELFQSLRTAVRDAVSWFLFLTYNDACLRDT